MANSNDSSGFDKKAIPTKLSTNSDTAIGHNQFGLSGLHIVTDHLLVESSGSLHPTLTGKLSQLIERLVV